MLFIARLGVVRRLSHRVASDAGRQAGGTGEAIFTRPNILYRKPAGRDSSPRGRHDRLAFVPDPALAAEFRACPLPPQPRAAKLPGLPHSAGGATCGAASTTPRLKLVELNGEGPPLTEVSPGLHRLERGGMGGLRSAGSRCSARRCPRRSAEMRRLAGYTDRISARPGDHVGSRSRPTRMSPATAPTSSGSGAWTTISAQGRGRVILADFAGVGPPGSSPSGVGDEVHGAALTGLPRFALRLAFLSTLEATPQPSPHRSVAVALVSGTWW